MWNQVYDPFGNTTLSTIAAALPVVTLLVLIASNKVKAHIAAIAALPLVRAFMAAEPMKGERGIDEVRFYSAVPDDYLRVNRYSILWRNVLHRPAPERALQACRV